MKARTPLAAIAILVVVLAKPSLADDRFNGIDVYIEAAMQKWQVPAVSIAVVKDGEVVLLRGYGVREVGQKNSVDGALSKTWRRLRIMIFSVSARKMISRP